jgi:hypothetical protein
MNRWDLFKTFLYPLISGKRDESLEPFNRSNRRKA